MRVDRVEAAADRCADRWAVGGGEPVVADVAAELDRALVDRAVGQHDHEQRDAGRRARRAGPSGSWPPRAGGPMTTAACSVRSDSSRLVSCSICSSSPWALSKNVRTCWACAGPSWPGPVSESTKKR